MSNSSKSKRIAKNTLVLYFRMLFLMAISLYTSRVVLKALGIDDYGIYNVVGGFVAMFSIISGSLSASITRFLNYEMGLGINSRLNRIFSSSVTIQIILAFIILLLAETIGLWFLNNKLQIPIARLEATNWVYQLSLITFVVNLLSIPYNAAIIAHEKMSAFAYIGIFEGISKLGIAFLILHSNYDNLVLYAILMCILSFIVRLIYGWYCGCNFAECKVSLIFDKSLFKQIFSFAGWNFIGAIAGVLRDQGGNVIINIFCGPSVNAARGISSQVNTAVLSFVTSFTMALNPQITQSYSSHNRDYMKILMFQGAKFSYFVLLLLSLPIIFNTPYILKIWLNDFPDYTVIFVRLTLILSMWESIASPISTGLLATGNIKWYQIAVGGINLLNLPVSYIFLRLGFSPEIVLLVAIFLGQATLFLRIFFVQRLLSFRASDFIHTVYLKLILVSGASCLLPSYFSYVMPESFLSLIFSSVVCLFSTVLSIYYLGCCKEEQLFVIDKINKIIKKTR